MLIMSKIKPIILWTIIPIIVILLGSLTTNNIIDGDFKLYEEKKSAVLAEVKPLLVMEPIKFPDLTEVVTKHREKNKEVKSEFVIKTDAIKLTKRDQIKCMAHNIYYEAGGESYMGQIAVARVVMNRVLHGFAENPCKVIYQTTRKVNVETERATIHCQFSWVCRGKLQPDTTSQRYKTAEEIAEQVIYEDKWVDEMPNNVLFFHNKSVNPSWPYRTAMVIGNHVFYSYGKEKKN